MELRHLRYFLAVADTLNFSRAARELRIDPSPLSRAIQQLEAEIGGPLFVRDTRKVELTALGTALVARAERVIADVDALTHDLQKRARGHADVRLGFRSMPHDILDHVVKAITGTAADIGVQLRPMTPHDQVRAVLAGELDLGLVQFDVEHRNLSSLTILAETQGLALPAEYADLEAASMDTLSDLTLLIPAGTDMANAAIERFGATAKDVLPVDFDIVGGFAALVASGGYCCFVPHHPAAPWHQFIAVPGVVIKPFIPTSCPVTSLVWRTTRDHDGDLGTLLSRVRAAFPEPVRR